MEEIERKFLLSSSPTAVHLRDGVPILQGYLFCDQGELRIRRKGDHFYLTVKGEGSLVRDEWEVEIPAWVFQTLWPKTEGRQIQKTRYCVSEADFTAEIDEYGGELLGLVTLESEFADRAAAERWSPPAWLGAAIEVTEDRAYKNKNLALYGLPGDQNKGSAPPPE